MGVTPGQLAAAVERLPNPPVAYGANCGVGASDLLRSVTGLAASGNERPTIAKGNAGVPHLQDGHIHYDGTPELMADYACLARDLGVRIIGGCCGTMPAHLRAMHEALETRPRGPRPALDGSPHSWAPSAAAARTTAATRTATAGPRPWAAARTANSPAPARPCGTPTWFAPAGTRCWASCACRPSPRNRWPKRGSLSRPPRMSCTRFITCAAIPGRCRSSQSRNSGATSCGRRRGIIVAVVARPRARRSGSPRSRARSGRG